MVLSGGPLVETGMAIALNDSWTAYSDVPASATGNPSYLAADKFAAVSLNEAAWRSLVTDAPLEFTSDAAHPLVVELPNPSGQLSRFAVVETVMMEPELAAKFPPSRRTPASASTIPWPRSDLTSPIKDSTRKSVRLRAVITLIRFIIWKPGYTRATTERTYCKPQPRSSLNWGMTNTLNTTSIMITYWKSCCPRARRCRVGRRERRWRWTAADSAHRRRISHYRAAVAATGEYTSFFGGTKTQAQSAIVTAMNRVSGFYEDELSVRMILVANNDQIVFTNSATDPYTNNNAFAMLGQNQSTIDSIIGNANYDIGHVFSTGAGGVAGFAVVGQSGRKAEGVTGISPPTGDGFWIDYVAHEMGHQYGGSHTFNGTRGSCSGGNRSGSSAYEPGSGSTIMAYAGICGGDNLQPRSDAYFHSRSLDQIISYLDVSRPNVGTRIDTGNSIPTAEAGPNYTIPSETPFELTGAGTDADGDLLVFNWEQRDLGPARRASHSPTMVPVRFSVPGRRRPIPRGLCREWKTFSMARSYAAKNLR